MRNLNICRNKRGKCHRIFNCLLAGLVIACAYNQTYSLDPNRTISQYTHDSWGIEKGFPGGTVYAVAQTDDGYLWIGTEKGLVRFDGLHFSLIQPNAILSPSEPILGLISDKEGNLWIRLRGTKIVRYRNGRFEDVLTDLRRPDFQITAMSLGSDGNILLSTLGDGTLRFGESAFAPAVPKSELPNSVVISVAETRTGEIWIGTRDAGLYRLREQKISAITNKLPDRKINCLLPDGERNLWVGTDKGIVHWKGTELTSDDVPPALNNGQVLTMLKDRQSNIWIGTESKGLLRLNSGELSSTEKSQYPSSKMVTALFEDREGNLWVGSPQGVERLRDNAFMTYTVAEKLPSDNNGAIYVDSEMRTWFAPSEGGLFWLKENKLGTVSNDGLEKDIIYSITGSKNDLWVGRQRGGLTQLHSDGTAFTSKTYTQQDGLAQNSVYTVYQSRDGETIWAGTLSGGASRFRNGSFTNYTVADGLAATTVTDITESFDGTVWFATPSGLSSYLKDNWRTFGTREGLPSEKVNCLLADSNGVIWFGTAKGLAVWRNGQIQSNSQVPAILNSPILGLAEDKDGFLWISTANHVLQIETVKLLGGALSEADVREFGIVDGLLGLEGIKRSRSLVADASGRIWFSLNRGISMVDPQHIKENSFPALVHINQITADGIPAELQSQVRIEAGHQRIIIGFAGLSLSVPERVRYRYKLENFDSEWSKPTAIQETVYTNLSPGFYRFHVIASNSEGIWNSREAVIEFEIAPLLWQTWWFRLFCLIAAVLLILMLFRVRLYRITGNLNLRFEERLDERTRIAQELHDSLLQGVVGASMQLDVAIDQLPENSAGRQSLSKVLLTMKRVMDEGRNTVRGLRSSSDSQATANNLEQSFSEFWQDLSVQEGMDFRLVVEGAPRILHPLVRDEIYRIGGEALINAVRHSGAGKIEIEIDYAAKHLKMSVRDDGCGIDSNILNAGREGHWGLTGMRERASRIGAKIRMWSRSDSGTEIELVVPGQIAFETTPSNNYWIKRLKKFYPRKPKINRLERKNEH